MSSLKAKWPQLAETTKPDAEWQKYQDTLKWSVRIEERVGRTPTDRLGWAVAFAQRDVDTFTQGEWADAAAELRAFCNFPFGRSHPSLPEHPLTTLDEWPTRALTEADIRAVQQAFKKFLEVLVIDKWADTGDLSIGVSVFLTENPQHPERLGVAVVARTDSIVTKAMWGLVTLLTAYGDRLRQCPECRRFFVASRTNQLFCGTRCMSRKSTRKYRERRKEQAPPRGGKESVENERL